MRDFAEKAWPQPGLRPHVVLRWAEDDVLQDLADQYAAALDPSVVTVLSRTQRHLTLAWVDQPVHQLEAAFPSYERARDYLQARSNTYLPPYLVIRQGAVTEHGVRLCVDTTRELDELGELAAQALSAGYGDNEAPIMAPIPDHIALAYGHTNSEALTAHTWPIDPPAVVTGWLYLVYLDAFDDEGLRIEPPFRDVPIPLGALYRDDLEVGIDPPPERPSRYTPHDANLSLPARPFGSALKDA